MKKLIALMIALVMCLGLVACGGKTEPETTTEPGTETVEPADGEQTEPETVVYPEGVTNVKVDEDGTKSFEYGGSYFTTHNTDDMLAGEGWYAADYTLADWKAEVGEGVYNNYFKPLVDAGKCTDDGAYRDAEAAMYSLSYDELTSLVSGVFDTMAKDPAFNEAA